MGLSSNQLRIHSFAGYLRLALRHVDIEFLRVLYLAARLGPPVPDLLVQASYLWGLAPHERNCHVSIGFRFVWLK